MQVVEEGKRFIEPNTPVSCAGFVDDNGDRLFKDLKSATWATLGSLYRSDKNDLGAAFTEIAINTDTRNAFCEADSTLQLESDKRMPDEALAEI